MAEHRQTNISFKLAGLLLGGLLLLLSFWCSLKFGFTRISFGDVWGSLFHYDSSVNEQIIVRTTRLPRALMAAAIGASLAIAGVIMQAVTRNPLASPSVLGVNAGASLFIVFAITVAGISQRDVLIWISFAGAAVGAVSVFVLGSLGREGLTPLKIVLAGAAMSALFMSFTQGLLVGNETGLQDVLFWLAGSVAGRPLEMLVAVVPYMGLSWVAAWLLSRHLNIIAAGDETAKGLGLRTTFVKIGAGILVVMLAGSAVAVAGPIGFIGIVIPHAARFVAGTNHRWLIPYSALFGANLLLLADIAARFLIKLQEVPVGVMTAAIGTPFFIYIARKGRMKSS